MIDSFIIESNVSAGHVITQFYDLSIPTINGKVVIYDVHASNLG